MIIALTPVEAFTVASVGLRRQLLALARGHVPDGNADEDRYFDHHIFGAMAEFAVARATNLFWHASIGLDAGLDVGGCISVRLRRLPGTGTDLAIRRKDQDHVPQVLVHNHRGREFYFDLIGWLYTKEARERGVWNERSNVWFAPPPYRSIEELIATFGNGPPSQLAAE